jgi:lysophospholipase L1-like esterase
MRFERYVALGDSQTEGLLDPDGAGGYRGWADRFAAAAAVENPDLHYANLAVRGRIAHEIHEQQLAPALALRPDLATVMGGFNDVLRPSFDPDAVSRHLESMISALTATGTTVLTNTFPDPAGISPLFSRMSHRVNSLNDRIRTAAARHGALVVDFAAHGVGTDLRIWSPDRIHANPFGHALIAAAFADTLGLDGHAHWTEPLPYRPALPALRRVTNDIGWLTGNVAPWLLRRLRGKSSGDGITAKRPHLVPVTLTTD